MGLLCRFWVCDPSMADSHSQGAARLVTVLRAAGVVTAVVSGGFTLIADRVAHLLGCDYVFANTVRYDRGRGR